MTALGDRGLVAGAARVPITPPAGREMAGYIRRTGPAEGVADELWCRVLVLDDGAGALVIVALDLLYATAALTARIRARLGTRLGVAPEQVMVTATHTHCGPGQLAGERDPELLDAIAGAADAAAGKAAGRARPARLATGAVEVPGVGRNRRDGRRPHDEHAHVVAVLPRTGNGAAIATLVVYACHPTILEHDTRRFSAEFPGAACAVVEQLCGGVGLFLQGCAADVNPIFTEHTPAECRRIGGIVGAAAGGLALRLCALGRGLRTINLSEERERPAADAEVGRLVAPAPLRGAIRTVAARGREHPDATAVQDELARLRTRPATARTVELWAEDLLLSGVDPLGDVDLPADGPTPIPVQGFRLGERLVLLALPGEPFAATGLALANRAGTGLLVAGFANESVGYLPPGDEVGRSGYEVGRSVYEHGIAEQLTTVAGDLAEELMRG